MTRPRPTSKSQKRATRASAAVITVLLTAATVIVDLFGTWQFPDIPSFRQLIGFLLISILAISVGALVIFRVMPERSLRISIPTDDIPLTVKYTSVGIILLLIDSTLFAQQGIKRATTIIAGNQAVISLLLSGLLVLLYYDQHQTQRQQLQIMSRQVSLEEQQREWRKEQRAPQINVLQWDFLEPDSNYRDIKISGAAEQRSSVLGTLHNLPLDETSVFFIKLENNGETVGKNLRLRIEPLISSPDLPEGYHDISILVLLRSSNFIDIRDNTLDQYLNRKQVDLDAEESAEYITTISPIPIAGLSNESASSIGEVIDILPLEVEDTVLRITLLYEDVGGESHEEPIGAVQVSPEEMDTLSQVFSRGNRVGYHGVPIVDKEKTREILEKRYAKYQSSGDGVVKVEFDLKS